MSGGSGGRADPHRLGARHGTFAVLTVSDSRTLESDRSGSICAGCLENGGHRVLERALTPDDPPAIRERLSSWLSDPACDGVLVNGGTGVAERDRTYEVVSALLDRRLDGFGELFRSLSYAEVGSSAMLSRAVGGIARGRIVFSLPGSPAAVRLAMDRLIMPELGHLLGLLSRGR